MSLPDRQKAYVSMQNIKNPGDTVADAKEYLTDQTKQI
jgi:hypothetical protein